MKHIDEVVAILVKQHDLSLVKDSHVSGDLYSHDKFRDLLIDFDFFRSDDKLTNMMSDLADKDAKGDTDYSFRMTIKHLTTRAVEVVGEAEKGTPPATVAVGDELNDSSAKLAARLMDYTTPFLVKDVLVDWQITIHSNCVYLWNFDGVLIASIDKADGVQCLACDPVHVNDALKETVAWLSEAA